MKKEIKIRDKDSESDLCVTVSTRPFTASDLFVNAIKGYIACLRYGKEFTPEPQLSREMSLSMAKTILPAKYTTTIRD